MQFELISDIHLEFIYGELSNPQSYLERIFSKPVAKTLLIAGDISSHLAEPNQGIVDFFDLVSRKYERVLAVLGNHDYINDFSTIGQVGKAVKEIFPEIIWLDNEGIDLGEVRVFGGTLWSQITEDNKARMSSYMIDYHMIEKAEGTLITPDDTNLLNRESKRALLDFIEADRSKPVVVLTHHAPCRRSSKWPDSDTTQGFCNDYDGLLKTQDNIRLWAHGHVHEPVDYRCGSVRVVAYPHGYLGHERLADSPYKPKLLQVRS